MMGPDAANETDAALCDATDYYIASSVLLRFAFQEQPPIQKVR